MHPNHRIVNVTGSSGVGKHTLTLAAGHFLATRKLFGDGVFFVELNTYQSHNTLCYAFARAFGISVNSSEELFSQLSQMGECLVIIKVRLPIALSGIQSTNQNQNTSNNNSNDEKAFLEELHLFLKELLRKTRRGFKVLLSSRQEIDFASSSFKPSPRPSNVKRNKNKKNNQREKEKENDDEDDDKVEETMIMSVDEFGIKNVHVGNFSLRHSLLLLKNVAPHLGRFSKQVAQLFGHLPFALKLIARYLQ